MKGVTDNLVIKIPERSVDQRKKDLVWLPENFVHDKEASKYGVAFDIGTTTVVGMLWDLEEGKLINSAARTILRLLLAPMLYQESYSLNKRMEI